MIPLVIYNLAIIAYAYNYYLKYHTGWISAREQP